MVTWSTRLSMILLLRSSRSFSKSFIFRSISSSSASTSVILTASASPSFTSPRWSPSTWMNADYNRIKDQSIKSTNDVAALYPLSYAHLSCTIMGIYHQRSGRSLCALSSFLPSECRRFFSVWARSAFAWHLDLVIKAMMMMPNPTYNHGKVNWPFSINKRAFGGFLILMVDCWQRFHKILWDLILIINW